jgi:glucose/arabinose dehydrogenase/mono/diheme cytochrome c family protein
MTAARAGFRALAVLPVVLALTACGAEHPEVESAPATSAARPSETAGAEISVRDFVAQGCEVCHGVGLEGLTAPALTPDALTESDAYYFDVIKNGRPGTSMPAWANAGLSDDEISSLVRFLRSGGQAGGSISVGGGEHAAEIAVAAPGEIQASPTEQAGSIQVEWPITNTTDHPVAVTRFTSPTLTLFHVGSLPIRIEPHETASLRLALTPNPELLPGARPVSGAVATVSSLDGGRTATLSVLVHTVIAEPAHTLAFEDVPVGGMPVRLATWGRFVYVALFDGAIEVYELADSGSISLVERITTIADTPNHGPNGAPEPGTDGRLIGGMTVSDEGVLYVAHTDPRLNEGELVQTGHLADLNSGTITRLHGRPGTYGRPENRIDLVTGLPRNVTNHVPSGMDIGQDGWLYVSIGAMTDSGVPDPSKPDPDTPISGAVLRINLDAPQAYPVVLTPPGPVFAGLDALVPGVVELWATGVRNGFGLAFTATGDLYLTDQSSDGGSTPPPLIDRGPPGISSNVGADHLHRVSKGDYLGQPNVTRDEHVLNDGSEYETAVASPGYAPPVHVFGIHSSATGVAEYRGELFPELEGWLLVGKFSGGLGLSALLVSGEGVSAVRTLAAPPALRNVTDVAVGPGGEIVVAEFWERRLRISRGYTS